MTRIKENVWRWYGHVKKLDETTVHWCKGV